MATREELEAAFMKAHQAGDTANAKILADAIRSFGSIATTNEPPVVSGGGSATPGAGDATGFLQAVQEGFGSEPVGPSPETRQKLESFPASAMGLINRYTTEPAMAAGEAAMRAGQAGMAGAGNLLGKGVGAITGMIPGANRVVGTGEQFGRDFAALPEAFPAPAGNIAAQEAVALRQQTPLKTMAKGAANEAANVLPAGLLEQTAVSELPTLPPNRVSLAEEGTHLVPAADKALNKLYQDMVDAGWTPDQIQAELKKLGPTGMPADLEPFAARQEAVAQTPRAGKLAAKALNERDMLTTERLVGDLQKSLPSANLYETVDAVKKARSTGGQQLRSEAMADPRVIKDEGLQRLLGNPFVRENMPMGLKLAKSEETRTGVPVPTSETWFKGENFDDPNIEVLKTPTLRILDAAKQGLTAAVEKYRNKNTGKLELDPVGVELKKVEVQLRDALRKHSAKYGEYLDKWGDDSQIIDAAWAGRRALKLDPEITKDFVKKLSPEARDVYNIGLQRFIHDKIIDNPQAAMRYFDKGTIEQRMKEAFPSEEAYDKFAGGASREAVHRLTFNAARANSPTVRRALGVADLTAQSDVPEQLMGAGKDLLTGNKYGLTRRVIDSMTAPIVNRLDARKFAIADEMAPVLYSTDPAVHNRLVNRLRSRGGLP